jgi:hypothetical protein
MPDPQITTARKRISRAIEKEFQHSPRCSIFGNGECDCLVRHLKEEIFFVPKEWLFKSRHYAQKQTHGTVVKVGDC